jgi:hypothetical protein
MVPGEVPGRGLMTCHEAPRRLAARPGLPAQGWAGHRVSGKGGEHG